MELADPRVSRAVLIGSASYTHLNPLPAVARNLVDLAEQLTSPDVWGLPTENCQVIADEVDPKAVGRVLRTAAAAVDPAGLLLVYYAGHGLIQENGGLVLGLPDCEPEVPDEAGLPYDRVRYATRTSPARRRVVILDCCYAGRAEGEMHASGTVAGELADRADIEETCLFVAAGANRPARSPENARHTAFTGELLRVIRDGLPGQAPLLTVRVIEAEVRRALAAVGLEWPELRERNSGGSIPLVRNAAISRRDLVGALLVAGRDVTDPELRHEVVLVLRHNETGGMGVRLTRPSGPLPDTLGDWRGMASAPARLFDGGPVARDGFIALTMLRPDADPPLRFTPLRGRLGSVPLTTPLDSVRHSIAGLRIFSGYLGWGPGELEGYLNERVLEQTELPLWSVLSGAPGNLWWPRPPIA